MRAIKIIRVLARASAHSYDYDRYYIEEDGKREPVVITIEEEENPHD